MLEDPALTWMIYDRLDICGRNTAIIFTIVVEFGWAGIIQKQKKLSPELYAIWATAYAEIYERAFVNKYLNTQDS